METHTRGVCSVAWTTRYGWRGRIGRHDISAFGVSLALHVITTLGLTWVAARASFEMPSIAEPQTTEIVVVQLPELPSPDSDLDGLRRPDTTPEDLGIRLGDNPTTVEVPGFSFEFSKVVDRAASLFPFLTRRPSFERVVEPPQHTRGSGLRNPLASSRTDLLKPPLQLSDAAIQSLVDKTWGRRDRWKPFQSIVELANGHNPNEGSLPILLKQYVVQNGLQPYVDTSIRDPRLWIQLGLASDHADFIDFISDYVNTHPSTKAATELLFQLDNLAQASLDALVTLLDADPLEDLQWTYRANRGAYDAIVKIREHYRAELERRHLGSREALKDYFHAVRQLVLTTIMRTTPNGYRAADARFLLGSVYWEQGKATEAARAWLGITIDPDDVYVDTYTQILISMSDHSGPTIAPPRINRILTAEQGRWVAFSFNRLRQFGYRFDTF